MNNIVSTLKELGLSTNEATVYIALTALGESKGSVVAKKAGLSRTTTLSILDRLDSESYITSHRYHGTVYYWIEAPEVIKNKLVNKIKLADELSSVLGAYYRSGRLLPTGKVLDTKAAIKDNIEKLLLSVKDATIYTIDSPGLGNYQKILADDYNNMLIGLKAKRSIATRTLIPSGSTKIIDPSKLAKQNIIIKELPPGIHFEASVWIVQNNLVILSGNPPLMSVIKHGSIISSFKSLFDYFWNNSPTVYPAESGHN
jgi:sugar-specific transcriptional regulator TrmB